MIKSEKPESDMSSESGILADHLNEDNLNDDHHHDRVINFNDHVTEDDPKQKSDFSSSPELLLEAIRRIGRDKLRNIMLDLSFGSKCSFTYFVRAKMAVTFVGPVKTILGQH